ncbi:hypothetical protein Hypma_005395 [Hypsizygus marmoreus]|uniref:Protein CPL1-like domain-containing protein n=1 Tax=Hypsizygus marmoreus TaxID=39966 RepID=A0A369K1V3_HYPMA|nr:hypothetical protein Hypma_005395 [Hypsizygus marmoreus]
MRLFAALAVSSLATSLLPSIAAIQYFPRLKAGPRSSVARAFPDRQYRVHRDVTDTCTSITGETYASLLGIEDATPYAGIQICVCVGDIDTWLDTDTNGLALSAIVGRETAKANLEAVFALGTVSESCTLPDHATRTCTIGSPCTYACNENYTPTANQCVCEPPFLECDGQCAEFPSGCASGIPRRKRRSLPVTTLAQAKSTCKPRESVCGIVGRENTYDFECVDTSVALDSCGGCVTPHPFYEPDRYEVKGIECGRLPGVISAGCSKGRCVVSQCRQGQEPSFDKSKCVSVTSVAQRLMLTAFKLASASYKRQALPGLTPNVDLQAQVKGIVIAVIDLHAATKAVPTLDGAASVDLDGLVQSIVNATAAVIKSNTVVSVVANVNTLVDSILQLGEMLSTLTSAGLEDLAVKLATVTQSALGLQTWIAANAIVIPKLPSIPVLGLPLPSVSSILVPNTSNLSIDLGLDGLLSLLGDLLPIKIDTGVVVGVNASITEKISGVGKLVLDLKAALPSLSTSVPASFTTSTGAQVSIDSSIAEPIVQAAIGFLASPNASAALSNIDVFVDASAAVATTLADCGDCVEILHLDDFVGILDSVGEAVLDLKKSLNLDSIVSSVLDLGLGGLLADLVGIVNLPGELAGNLDLQIKISTLVKLILGLQEQTSSLPTLLPAIPSVPSPGLPDENLLGAVVNAVTALLQSVNIGDLLKNIEALIQAISVVNDVLSGCQCVSALGLGDVQSGVDVVLKASNDLKIWVDANAVAELSVTGPIIVNADVLIKALGVNAIGTAST